MHSSTPVAINQRYVVSEDGHTVFDSKTGLTWQRNHLPRMTWSEAIDAADQANVANQFSHSDWRVPTKAEMESLINMTAQGGPKIDQEAFPKCPASWFWTSENPKHLKDFVWFVDFYVGYTLAYVKSELNFVRLVRGGQDRCTTDYAKRDFRLLGQLALFLRKARSAFPRIPRF